MSWKRRIIVKQQLSVKQALTTLCPASRLDVMSHEVDCVFQYTEIQYTTHAFNGNPPEICNLPCVTSRLISKLDRKYLQSGDQ